MGSLIPKAVFLEITGPNPSKRQLLDSSIYHRGEAETVTPSQNLQGPQVDHWTSHECIFSSLPTVWARVVDNWPPPFHVFRRKTLFWTPLGPTDLCSSILKSNRSGLKKKKEKSTVLVFPTFCTEQSQLLLCLFPTWKDKEYKQNVHAGMLEDTAFRVDQALTRGESPVWEVFPSGITIAFQAWEELHTKPRLQLSHRLWLVLFLLAVPAQETQSSQCFLLTVPPSVPVNSLA